MSFLAHSQTWITTFNSFDSLWAAGGPQVYVFFNDEDSSLFIGGAFQKVNNINVNGIFMLKNNNFYSLNNGITQFAGTTEALNKYNNNLFMGGGFLTVDNQPNTKCLAIWNGTSWSGPSIGQANAEVYDFKIFDNKLFVSGTFGQIGSQVFDRIASFDGTNWINVGSLGMWTKALESFNGELYAGGYYGIRKYLGGTSWIDVSDGPQGWIYELKTDTFNNFLYAGGNFMYLGNNEPSYAAAMWDGFKWNVFDTTFIGVIMPQAMAIYRGDLYAGSGDTNYKYITRWDGNQWYALGNGTNNVVSALEVFQDTLYVGGHFTYVNGNQRAYGLAKWYMPDTSCNYIKPRVFTLADTFYLSAGHANVQFYNNNAYVNSWSWDFGDSGTDNVKDPIHSYNDTGTYTATVTVTHNGCTKTAQKTITILNGNGLDEYTREKLNFKIYPNPTSSEITVELTLPNLLPAELRIYNIFGSIMDKYNLEKGFNKITVSANLWAKGESLIGLFVDRKQVLVEKVVKK